MSGFLERSIHKSSRTQRRRDSSRLWIKLPILFLALVVLSGCVRGSRVPPAYVNPKSTASLSAATEEPSIKIDLPTPTRSSGSHSGVSGNFETYLYSHPDRWFTFQAPEGWLVDHSPIGVTFVQPQGRQQIKAQVVNTGYPLEEAAFAELVEAREAAFARQYAGYVEIDRETIAPGSAILITKSYIDRDFLRTGQSYYQLQNQMVFAADFWTDEDNLPLYQELFRSVYSSATLDEEEVASLTIYSFGQGEPHSNGHFSILTSPFWQYHRIEGNSTIVETFTSPDEQAVIQTVIYDDGKPVSRGVAGELTLSLLRNSYTTDIMILNDTVLDDGREKLTWSSLDGSYQGITTFTTQGTTLNILTVMWDNDPERYYQTVLEKVIVSYTPDK